jgi:hypothetical protein
MALSIVAEQPELPHMEPGPQPKQITSADILGLMTTLASVLTVRLMLLLTLVGSFVLTLQAMSEPSLLKIWVLVIYNVLVVGPVAFLARRA